MGINSRVRLNVWSFPKTPKWTTGWVRRVHKSANIYFLGGWTGFARTYDLYFVHYPLLGVDYTYVRWGDAPSCATWHKMSGHPTSPQHTKAHFRSVFHGLHTPVFA